MVFLAHGFGEHCGRYEHVAQYLASRKINVYAVDHQGHGQSTGTFTFFQKFEHLVDDFKFFIETTVSTMNDFEKALPKFLLGHSMGGAVAVHTALLSKNEFTGVILSGPMLAPDASVATPTRVKMAKMMSKLLPKLPVGSLDIKTICSDSTVVKLALSDRLYSELPMVARVAYEFLAEMDYLQSVAAEVTFRYYVLFGSDDKIASVEGISLWHNNTKSPDKKSTCFPGLFHEPFHERESEEVLDSVAKWIRDRLTINEPITLSV